MESRASNFKRKGSTIEPKHLRVHRRSLDWKQLRNDEVNRRRNCEDMSPLVEVDDKENRSMRFVDDDSPNSTPTRRGRCGTPKKSKTPLHVAKRQQLLRWKEERNLKKKLEAAKKKPCFKVYHVKNEAMPKFSKTADKKTQAKGATVKQTAIKVQPSVKKPKEAEPVGRRSTRIANKSYSTSVPSNFDFGKSAAPQKVDPPVVTRNTRSSKPSVSNTRVTRQRKPATTDLPTKVASKQETLEITTYPKRRGVDRSVRVESKELVPEKKEEKKRTGKSKSDEKVERDMAHLTKNTPTEEPESVNETPTKGNPFGRQRTRSSARLKEIEVNSSSECDDVSNVHEEPVCVESPPIITDVDDKAEEEDMEVCSEETEECHVTTTVPTTPKSGPTRRKSVRRSLAKCITFPDSSEVCQKQADQDEVLYQSDRTSSETDLKEQEEVVSSTNETIVPVARRTRKSMSALSDPEPVTPKSTSRRRTMAKEFKMKSPEEWVKLLAESPMVEMTRRTPKIKTPPESVPLSMGLDFEEMDFMSCPEQENNDEEFSASDSFMEFSSSNNKVVSTSPREINDENKENEVEVPSKQMSDNIIECETEIPETVIVTNEEKPIESQELDVPYFRRLMASESKRLNGLCETWEGVNGDSPDLTEEVKGEIRTTVGQAQLLMDQRFKQFSGLVDNCEFGSGDKETTCTDLQGFWEMIYFQVEDVDKKFADLVKRKEANWVVNKVVVNKKEPKKKPVSKGLKSKPAVKSKFAAFRAQMKKQKEDGDTKVNEMNKVFDAGFFKVSSPQKTPTPHCAGGTPTKSAPKEEVLSSPSQDNDSAKLPTITVSSNLTTPVPAVLNRTPRRQSYVPAVPSPLLCDITPSRAKRRRSYRNTPIPKKEFRRSEGVISSIDLGENTSPGKSKRHNRSNSQSVSFCDILTAPASDDHNNSIQKPNTEEKPRRSLKCVSFCETDMSMPVEDEEEGNENILLQYLVPSEKNDEKPVSFSERNDSSIDFGDDEDKHLHPLETPAKDVEVQEKPKSALKKTKTPQSARRKSARLSVHFAVSPKQEDSNHSPAPQTPYNRNSLVPRSRVNSGSCSGSGDSISLSNPDAHKENSPMGKLNFSQTSNLASTPLKNTNRKDVLETNADLMSFSPL